jgi:uncharacterized protein
MREIIETPHHSMRVGALPKGCRLCVKGRKMVLLATGVCSNNCWYCPLSREKKDRDVVVANEWWIRKDADIIREAKMSGAWGAGITGGDPLCRLDKTLKLVRLLKKKFGRDFHIHLYSTPANASRKSLHRLHKAGVDEIRFHPNPAEDSWDLKPVGEALKLSWDVGVEIPALPGHLRRTKRLINELDDLGVEFVNINQLELSETNANALEKRGYETGSGESFAVKGSGKMAGKLLAHIAGNTRLRAHYCTVKLKDGVQLRNRMRIRAKNTAREYDIVTGEGLLIRGAVYVKSTLPSFGYRKRIGEVGWDDLKALRASMRWMKREYGLPEGLVELDAERGRILTGAWIVEEIGCSLRDRGLIPAVVEEYPTWDKLLTDLRLIM